MPEFAQPSRPFSISFVWHFSIRTLLLVTFACAVVSYIATLNLDGSILYRTSILFAYVTAWLVPAGSVGWDVERSRLSVINALSWGLLWCALSIVLIGMRSGPGPLFM